MRKKGKIFFNFLIIVFIINAENLFSQTDIKYERKYDIGSSLSQIDKIIFTDSISGRTKIFNLIQDNPFNKFGFIKIGQNDQDNIIFNLTFEEIGKLIPMSLRAGYTAERKLIKKSQSGYYGTSYYSVYKEAKNFSVIYYNFFILDSSDYSLGVLGAILIFTKSGECIFEDKNIGFNVNKSVITDNGNYLSYTYGLEDEYGFLVPEGYRIIELNTKKIIIDRQYNNLGSPFIKNNLIINGYDLLLDRCKYVYEVFDSEHKCLYTNGYYNEEIGNLREITDKGFKFIDKNNNLTFDSFDDKFKKETIK